MAVDDSATSAEELPVPPSGQQAEIRWGPQQATVVEVGGGVRTYRIGGLDVIDGYGIDEMCPAVHGQPLIPWPNRLRGGAYDWDGESYQVPIDEPDKGNALHGLTRWRNWTVRERTESSVTVGLRLHPRAGYPFTLDLAVRYEVGPGGLTVATTAHNVGARACPYAHGAHPYVTVGTERVDAALLRLPASTYLLTDETQIPTDRRPVDGTPFDFRRQRPVGDVAIDHCFTDLQRDRDGMLRLVLSAPDASRSVTVWADRSYPHLQIFTGDALAEPERRRRSLGVEPMTAPPNAFATGEGLRRLEPGTALTTRWGISPQFR